MLVRIRAHSTRHEGDSSLMRVPWTVGARSPSRFWSTACRCKNLLNDFSRSSQNIPNNYLRLEANHILLYRVPAFDHVTNDYCVVPTFIHYLISIYLVIEPRLTSFLKTLPLKTRGFRARE